MDSDGSDQVNLTNVTNASVLTQSASWSPDGTKLVFERAGSGKDGFDVWVGAPDPATGQLNDQKPLTSGRGNDRQPAWSPDGTRIAFASDRDGDFEIYRIPASGGTIVRLTDTPADETAPDWAPDSGSLTFVRSSGTGKHAAVDVYRMNADGTGPIRLTTDPAVDGAPDWSPDGTLIAFTREMPEGNEIYTMQAQQGEAGGVTRLTNNADPDFSPDWETVAPTPTPTPGGEVCPPEAHALGLC
jgi:Tol biopolymer transport system component